MSAGEAAFLVEVVENGGVDGNEFLQGWRPSETEHGSLSSSKRQVRIFCSIVQPATCLNFVPVSGQFHY